MKRIISQTFSISLDQLERLSDVAARTRVSRSSLLREAIDVVLARYEQPTKVDGVPAESGRESTTTRT